MVDSESNPVLRRCFFFRYRNHSETHFFIGLRFLNNTRALRWDDGTAAASDTPMSPHMHGPLKYPNNHFGRISSDKHIMMGAGDCMRFALCGNCEFLMILLDLIMRVKCGLYMHLSNSPFLTHPGPQSF